HDLSLNRPADADADAVERQWSRGTGPGQSVPSQPVFAREARSKVRQGTGNVDPRPPGAATAFRYGCSMKAIDPCKLQRSALAAAILVCSGFASVHAAGIPD